MENISPNFKIVIISIFIGLILGFGVIEFFEYTEAAYEYCLDQGNSESFCHGALE